MSFLIKHRFEVISLVLIALYASVLGYFYLGIHTYLPDELWFLRIANEMATQLSYFSISDVITHTKNYLGYGQLYWMFYAFLEKNWIVLGLTPMRLVALIAAVSVPVLYVWRARVTGANPLWIMFFWLMLPTAWWFGKVTGPDLMAQSVGLIGVTLILMDHRKIIVSAVAFLFLGLAVGIKLSVFPLCIFAAILFLLSKFQKKIYVYAIIASCFIIGFIMANPFMVFSFERYIQELKSVTANASTDIDNNIWVMFFSNHYTWDKLLSGSFFSWFLTPVSSIIFLGWMYFLDIPKKVWISLGITFCITTAMIFLNPRYLGWYWFPFILLIPFLLTEARKQLSMKKMIVAILIICVCNVPNIMQTVDRASHRLNYEEIKT